MNALKLLRTAVAVSFITALSATAAEATVVTYNFTGSVWAADAPIDVGMPSPGGVGFVSWIAVVP